MPASLSQKLLLQKLTKYLKLMQTSDPQYSEKDVNNIIFDIKGGQCVGFGGLYIFFRYQHTSKIFFKKIERINSWNGEEKTLSNDLKKDIDQMFSWMRVFFYPGEAISGIEKTRQADRKAAASILGGNFPSEQLRMTYMFNDDLLGITFKRIFNTEKDTYIDLNSNGHNITIAYKEGEIWCYDSNSKAGEVTLDSVEKLVSTLKSGFDIDNDTHYYAIALSVYSDPVLVLRSHSSEPLSFFKFIWRLIS